MRDRRVQRLLKKTKEKGLSPKDHTGMPDVTPFEAVKRIIEEEKKQIIAAAREKLSSLAASAQELEDRNTELLREINERIERHAQAQSESERAISLHK